MKSSKFLGSSISLISENNGSDLVDLIVEPDVGAEELSLDLDKGVLIELVFRIGVKFETAVAADNAFI